MPPRNKKKDADKDPFDDYRGEYGMGGWWISLKDAESQTGYKDERWWATTTREGRRVEPVQHVKNAPAGRPVWLFDNGDMYLGGWTTQTQQPRGGTKYPEEHGFGITYNEFPYKSKGLIYIGEWQDGESHGKGESFWLESSRTWKQNYFPGSAIQKRPGGGIPFHYCGKYKDGLKCDKEAIVKIKDGTARKGPWKDGHPVGSWENHTSVAWGGTSHQNLSSSSSTSDEEEEVEEVKPSPAAKRQRTARQQRQDEREETQNPNPPIPSVAIKLEPSDDEEEENRSAAVQAAIGARGNPLDANADKQRRLQQIQKWISETVIGNNPSPATMERYASKLFAIGFESVEMVKARLKPKHVESYEWMSALHKEIFLDHIYEEWEEE